MSGHLALTRRNKEGITLETEDGEHFGHIFVDRASSNQTKVYLDLPDNIKIIRDELIERDKEAVR